MPISAKRIIRPEQVRNFGRFGDAVEYIKAKLYAPKVGLLLAVTAEP